MLLRVRAHVRRLPIEVSTLALMDAAGCLLCVLGAISPMSDAAPRRLDFAMCVLAVCLVVALLVAGRRTPRWAIHANVVVSVGLACMFAALAKTPGGEMLSVVVMTWIGIYCTLFLSRTFARRYAAAMIVGLGIAVLVAGLPAAITVWIAGALTISLVVGVVGHLMRRLSLQAETDVLTGLPNRAALERAALRERAIARRTGATITVAVIDLDGFKLVNDRNGHAAGDRVLTELTAAWRSALRPADLLSRFGGDEFVILFPDTDRDTAESVIDRLAETHPAPWSYGLEPWPLDEPLEACLARADRRLYDAKQVGGVVVAVS